MIRTKGEAGTGNIVEAVHHYRTISEDIQKLKKMNKTDIESYCRKQKVDIHLLKETLSLERLPIVNFAAGGIATPADAALMMQLGCDGVFVGSGIFKSGDPIKRAKAIVESVTHFNDAKKLAEISENLGEAMVGIEIEVLDTKLAERGW